jgi:uncharacterized membrane-anchored protein
MKQLSVFLVAVLLFNGTALAQDDSLELTQLQNLKLIDSIEKTLHWKTGEVIIGDGIVKLNVITGFKLLDAEQSKYILHDIWGNPPREDVLGMLFPDNSGPFSDSSYAFIISYEETGYIKDADADKIDYEEMLGSIQKSEKEANEERTKQGYESVHIVRWAQSPFYDKNRKVLHWAKEIKFGGQADNTLNYDVRVLGRKGILSLNAVATMHELSMVKANINKVLTIPEFTPGNKYSDFNSNTDKVAAYGISAVVAGGILAKTGILAIIGKFLVASWKFILVGVIAAIAGVRKFLGRKKEETKNA